MADRAGKNYNKLALAILEQQYRDPLRFYQPYPKQKIFHESRAHKKFFIAGNGAGKTYTGVHEFVMAAMGRHWIKGLYPPPPLDMRICAETEALVGGGETSMAIIPLLERLLGDQVVKRRKSSTGIYSQWTLKNGTYFDILTYNQDDDKFESVSKDVIWFDEPFRQAIYIASVARMRRGKGGNLLFTLTPLFEAAWMYDRFIDRSKDSEQDVNITYATVWDNCMCRTPEIHGEDCRCGGGFLTKSAIDLMIAEYDEELMDARVMGQFITMRDRVFADFDPEVHIIDSLTAEDIAKMELQLYVGVDPHRRKPPAWGLYGYDKDNTFYIIDEYPNYLEGIYKGRFYETIKKCDETTGELVAEFNRRELKFGGNILKRFMDPRFAEEINTNTRRPVIDEYRIAAKEQDIDMRFQKAIVGSDSRDGEIASGIIIIKDKLKYSKSKEVSFQNSPKLLVCSNCVNHIRMFQFFRYSNWQGKSAEGRAVKEAFLDQFKDFCDVPRYVIKSVPGYKSLRKSRTDYAYKPSNRLTGY